MSGTNDFLVFATGGGANVESQADYAADAIRGTGNVSGIASSAFNNKAIRQANFVTSQVAQFLANVTGANILDNTIEAQLLSQMFSAWGRKAPVVTVHSSSTGTHNISYKFQIAVGSATVGATYTNNSITYTVSATIASGLELIATGSGTPLVSGTLTKTGGTGDSTITFYAVRAPLYLKVKMVGGGGGGGGSGNSGTGGQGGTGGNTTFGTTLLAANGGTGGTFAGGGTPGAGGTASLGTGPVGIALQGSSGGGLSGAITNVAGPVGAVSPLGGAGFGGNEVGAGGAAIANTGSGGGGGGSGTTNFTGQSGCAGGFIDAIITSPLSTYAWTVGAAGAAGTAGTGGSAGGAGGSGVIIVEECYQ